MDGRWQDLAFRSDTVEGKRLDKTMKNHPLSAVSRRCIPFVLRSFRPMSAAVVFAFSASAAHAASQSFDPAAPGTLVPQPNADMSGSAPSEAGLALAHLARARTSAHTPAVPITQTGNTTNS